MIQKSIYILGGACGYGQYGGDGQLWQCRSRDLVYGRVEVAVVHAIRELS